MSVKERLQEIVGAENFSDQPEALMAYSSDLSLEVPGMPNYVVKPKKAEEISQIITLANENLIPVVPSSSQVHFYGATIPRQGGIVMDLSRMNQILEVDLMNRKVRIEAGVTWGQLTRELEGKGLRMILPLLPHPERSVVVDTLEREVLTNTVYDYGEPLQSMEVVWPTGEIFRTGSASVNGYPDSPSKGGNPSGPGMDFYRFLQGAQGTFGVVTWANIKMEYIPKMDKVLFAPVTDLGYTIDFLHRILKIRIGQECVLLNDTTLASILSDGSPDDFERVRAMLPPMTLVLVLSGLDRRPEEKLQYETNMLNQVIRHEFPEMVLSDALAGFPNLGRKFLELLRNPWPEGKTYWKSSYKGACQSLSFFARPNMAPEFITTVQDIAAGYDYPIADLGIYLQPIEHNRACQLEFEFFYDPTDEYERQITKQLFLEAAEVTLAQGAYYSRPYGDLAPMLYDKAAGYTAALKRVKKVFDPNNILNPGKLCF